MKFTYPSKIVFVPSCNRIKLYSAIYFNEFMLLKFIVSYLYCNYLTSVKVIGA